MIEIEMDLSGLLPPGQVSAQLLAAALSGLEDGAEHVLKLARDRVPLEEGTLERSGIASSDGHNTVAVSFDTPYAVRQHEDMSLRHDAGRSAKYLELAVSAARPAVIKMVAASVRRVTG